MIQQYELIQLYANLPKHLLVIALYLLLHSLLDPERVEVDFWSLFCITSIDIDQILPNAICHWSKSDEFGKSETGPIS